ncbi:MAG: right-handed parallel beta-helix repeat-containing protein [Ignavibacteria bacterium]|nr:right-handed parallel beta-helix repeat-containing protein [Ignavibacteria bacterium]
MDSLIANSLSDEITDPYGTLAGCVLFSAWHSRQSDDSIVTGMYKNSQIVWDDYPGTKAGFASALLTTKDINNDGEVDILEAETDFTRNTRESSISYLWILSWNGTIGRLINDIDSVTHQSTLVSTDGWYDLVDINRDGIMEIRGEIDHWQKDFPNLNPPTLPSITYSWNGSKYGFFASAHQINENEFYPADLMGVSMHSNVVKNNNNYIYNYSIANQPTSKQSIENIYIGGLRDTSSNYAPAGWHASSSSYVGGRYFYNSTYQLRGTISPGQSLSGFGTVSISPPAIVKYHVQGYRWYGQTATDEEHRNDILTNSVSGYTLGTTDTTQPFVPLNFLDTLKGYITQSRSLGWIGDQQTADKYAALFDSGKAQLQRNDNRTARATLDSVMANSTRDSSTVLTSEAYALIFFNAQYLLSQLPVPPPQYQLTIATIGSGSVSKNPDLTLYDSAMAVQLTATPASGYNFSGWSGDASGSANPMSLTINGNKTITATFTQSTFIITASAGTNGTVTPSGAVSVNSGSSQSFTITPSAGYHIDSVIVDGTNQGAVSSYSFTNVTASHSISASFSINTYTIAATAGSNGSISPSGSVAMNYGANQTFTITANPCYQIDSVIVDGVNQGALSSYTFTNVTANHTIRTVYKINTYTITPTAGSNGSISPSTATSVNCGSSQTFTITPNSCYRVDSLIVDGINQGSLTSYTFTNVAIDHTIRATFVINKDTITASSGSNGTISPSGAVIVSCGSNQTFTVMPNLGYKVSDVLVDGSSVGAVTSYTLSNITVNHTISATFVIDHNLAVPTKFSTIQAAVNFARYGDTVAVSPGSYSESVSITLKDSLTILATGGIDQVTVKGFTVSQSHYTTIKGFIVDATGTGTNAISLDGDVNDNSDITLDANLIRNATGDGVKVSEGNPRLRIVNNRIHNNSKNGITIVDPDLVGGGPHYLINNTIVKNGWNGVNVAAQDIIYLVNNVLSFNGTASGSIGGRYGVQRAAGTGIQAPIKQQSIGGGGGNPSGIRLINNLIIGNNGTVVTTVPKSSKDIGNYTETLDATDSGNLTTAGNEGTGVVGSSNQTFSQVFQSSSPIDLHLKSGSFAINRGVNSWSPPDASAGAIPSKDFEGTTRPQGANVDLGADEY